MVISDHTQSQITRIKRSKGNYGGSYGGSGGYGIVYSNGYGGTGTYGSQSDNGLKPLLLLLGVKAVVAKVGQS